MIGLVDMSDEDNPVIQEVEKSLEVEPYTKVDRVLTYAILTIVTLNLIIILSFVVPWGSL